jgi:competence protein ComEC
MGPYTGAATLVTDPDPVRGAVRVVLRIDGYRYEVWARGMPAAQLRKRLAGEVVVVTGERRPPRAGHADRLAVRHIVGRFDVLTVVGAHPGGPPARAANRLHRRVVGAVDHWPADDAALFRGLVVGNDREVSDELVAAFRRSGLAHLTAVSGHNVSYVLAVAALVLRHFRPAPRWAASLVVIAWFALLTRFEPSVLRASFMAGLSLTAGAVGGDRRPHRLLPMAVTVLVLIDPLLVWSVSFWLSVSATAGLVWITPALARVVPGPRLVAVPISVTTGAQLGVLPIATLVFGLPSSISLVTNLVAVPVGGAVMLAGLPLALGAGALPLPLAGMVMWPAHLGVRWVAGVARVGDNLAPSGWLDVLAWVLVGAAATAAVVRRRRGR